jgi:hypothetical protein
MEEEHEDDGDRPEPLQLRPKTTSPRLVGRPVSIPDMTHGGWIMARFAIRRVRFAVLKGTTSN